MLTNIKHWLWLTTLLAPPAAWQVYTYFGSPEKAYYADPSEYQHVPKLTSAQRQLLSDKSLLIAEQIIARCDSHNVRILTYQDTEFPDRLRNISVPPLVLYLRGKMVRFDDRVIIAFAGTRRCSLYGGQMAETLAQDVTRQGALVSTGLASGCDEAAVRGALKAKGPLLCVVAGGVDVPYQNTPEGIRLLEQITACGTLISEQPPGIPHRGSLFHRRNALFTALSSALLCVEAGRRSGVMNVAAIASEQGREIFAVPANVGIPSSAGTNELLQKKLAQPALSADDLLAPFSFLLPGISPDPGSFNWTVVRVEGTGKRAPSVQKSPASAPVPAPSVPEVTEKRVDTGLECDYIELLDTSDRWSETDRLLLKQLLKGPASIESLIAAVGLPAADVSAALTILAISGIVQECSGGRYQVDRSQLS